ncbi:pseudouridine synthase [Methylovorus mays]|uniref:pseudouridine synthase n=1 Tax=Methylovorus mays TaxID=184077 RepID=UPI001E289605|nr:pseudouridine synthase [Methylovorus mays]MCB5208126.1 pseudouridine synthase [Methylovorus mays]
MTTLKLPPKATPDDSNAPSGRKPVRRADPAKRPRDAASKPVAHVPAKEAEARVPANKPARAVSARPSADRAAPKRQRNHRHDGTLHEHQVIDSPADTDRPRRVAADRSPSGPARSDSPRPAGARSASARQDGTRPERSASDRPARTSESRPRAETARPDSRSRDERPAERSERPRRPAADRADRLASDRDTPRRGGKARDGFVAGDFNRDRTQNPMFTPKPVASQPDLPRLSKRMAELGLCSRREADEWIVNGWVRVNGKVVDELGSRVEPDANIEVSKEAEKHQSEIVTILLHKPVGYVSGQAEDGYEPAVVLVHPDNHWAEDPVQKEFRRGFLKGLAPAGRLDIDSTGLLVLTQDGRVARQLIGEDSQTEKEYLVRVEGTLSDEGLRKLNHGLSLDGVQLKPAKVSWQNEDQLRFVLREGRKRQIRRMCELVGLHVVGLKRVRIGSVALGKLPPGQWRYLRPGERF